MNARVKFANILIVLFAAIAGVSFAADYPTKPITLIKPHGSGRKP